MEQATSIEQLHKLKEFMDKNGSMPDDLSSIEGAEVERSKEFDAQMMEAFPEFSPEDLDRIYNSQYNYKDNKGKRVRPPTDDEIQSLILKLQVEEEKKEMLANPEKREMFF